MKFLRNNCHIRSNGEVRLNAAGKSISCKRTTAHESHRMLNVRCRECSRRHPAGNSRKPLILDFGYSVEGWISAAHPPNRVCSTRFVVAACVFIPAGRSRIGVLNGKRRSVVPANAMVINSAPMISAQIAKDMNIARLECTTSARNVLTWPQNLLAKDIQVLHTSYVEQQTDRMRGIDHDGVPLADYLAH